VPITGRSAIVVDDGIATGTTIRAVIKALRLKRPKSIVLAVPVAPLGAVNDLRKEADDVVCLETPEPLFAIGLYYRDFHQITDDEVIRLLLIGWPEVERAAVPAPPAKIVGPVPPEKPIVAKPPAKAAKPAARKPARAKKRKRGKAPARRPSSSKSVRPS
jgi:hypothetical protein